MQTANTIPARSYARAGLSIVPIRPGTKIAAVGWSEYQKRLPTEAEVAGWFDRDSGRPCAIICGAVSGNLEILDFDFGGVDFEAWTEGVERRCPGLVGRLTIQRTPSDGRHAIYRCPAVEGNRKLTTRRIAAEAAGPIEWRGKSIAASVDRATGEIVALATTIETRGEGGYFLVAPSPGYAVVQGDLADPPTITPAERAALLGAASELDESPPKPEAGSHERSAVPPERSQPTAPTGEPDSSDPGRAYNRAATPGEVVAMLTRHGWAFVREDDRNIHLRRPGKNEGSSGTVWRENASFRVFSTSAEPFEADKDYSPFAVLTMLEHAGDFSAAASALRAEGFGGREHAGTDYPEVDLSELMDRLIASCDPDEDAPDDPPPLPMNDVFPDELADLREYFAAVANSTQTPIEAVAMLALAMLSGACAKLVIAKGHGDHREPPQLWSVVLCESGTRKSSIFGELVGPFVEWEAARAAELAPEIAKKASERRILERRLNKAEAIAADADADDRQAAEDEAARLAEALDRFEVPSEPQRLASESTPEALAVDMAANHERILVASPEGGPLDILIGRYQKKGTPPNLDMYLSGHAGDEVRHRRIGRPHIRLRKPALAMALIAQPVAIRPAIEDPVTVGRGLPARFLLAWPPDLRGRRKVRTPKVPESLRAVWTGIIGRLLDAVVPDRPVEVELDAEADDLYYEFQEEAEAMLAPGGRLRRDPAWGSKLPGATLRGALVLATARRLGLDAAPWTRPEIAAAEMRAAIAWSRWLIEAGEHAAGRLLGGSVAAVEGVGGEHAELLAWLRARPEGATVRELARVGPRRYRQTGEAKAALDALAGANLGRWRPRPGGRTLAFYLENG